MVEQRELKRVMAIVRAHARDALNKHDTQRESFLAYCRNNWKRYAAGFTKSSGECDRFAATLDYATRDLIALAEASPDRNAVMQILYGEQPPAWKDSIEGAMDSVVTHEAYLEPEIIPEPAPAEAAAPTADESLAIRVTEPAARAAPSPLAAAPEASAQRSAEEEDRQAARYGFRSPAEMDAPAPQVELPEHAQELQRKVRAVLLAHRADKS